jgi:IS5 family transposase
MTAPASAASVGFAAHEPTPERTAFVRFRRELVARGLDGVLFETVTRQLDARGVVVKTGTLVDATVIASATPLDDEARWVGHRRKGGGARLQGACRL